MKNICNGERPVGGKSSWDKHFLRIRTNPNRHETDRSTAEPAAKCETSCQRRHIDLPFLTIACLSNHTIINRATREGRDQEIAGSLFTLHDVLAPVVVRNMMNRYVSRRTPLVRFHVPPPLMYSCILLSCFVLRALSALPFGDYYRYRHTRVN